MPKMHYFSNKFSKIAKRWGLSAPAPLSLRFWWPEVKWCGQILFFQADYDEMKLQKNQSGRHFSDVMAIMSPKNVIIKRRYFFPFWTSTNPNFWLRQCYDVWCYEYVCCNTV